MTGGIAVHVAELSRTLGAIRPVRVVTPGPRARFVRSGPVEVRVAHRFPVTPLPPLDTSPEVLASLRFLRKAQAIHAHDPRVCVAAKILDRPLVTTFHGYLTREAAVNAHTAPGRPLYELLDRTVAFAVDRSRVCIAVDRRIAAWLATEYGAANVRILPNAVDTEAFRPQIQGDTFRREYGLPVGVPIVLAAKHFVPKNGMTVVVRAFPRVLEKVPEALLVLAGHGDQEPLLRTMVRDLSLVDHVRFPGQIPHDWMPEAQAAADVCVISSVPIQGVEEATSILGLEAMASGTPLVASDIGGLKEIVKDGVTGLLVPPNDPGALSDALVRLLEDSRMRQFIGAAARAYVVSNHSWSRAARQVSELLDEAIAS